MRPVHLLAVAAAFGVAASLSQGICASEVGPERSQPPPWEALRANHIRLGGRVIAAQMLGMRKLEACAFSSNERGLELTLPNGAQAPSDLTSVVRLDLR